MKDNILYRIFLVSLILVSLIASSCNDFLSENQDNRTTIDSKDKIRQLLVNAYANAQYAEFAESMSDNAADKGPGAEENREVNEKAYKWEDFETSASSETTSNFWVGSYGAISYANQALVSIEELGGGVELSQLKGEALVARAYAHFMLVNFFSMRYDPATADTDLGVPYVFEPETSALKDYSRASVAEVYRLIEKDLEEGLPLVGNEYEEPKFHFTINAARAFATRFYLYKGDWGKVVENADVVLSDPATQIRDLVSLEYRSLPVFEARSLYSSAAEKSNLLVSWTNSAYARNYIDNRYGLSTQARDGLFGSTGNPFSRTWGYRLFGNAFSLNLPKYSEYFRITNISAGVGFPFVSLVHFTMDEVLLNRAEAYAMMDQFDASLEDLQAFLSQKTMGFDSATHVLTMPLMTATFPVVPDEYTPAYTLSGQQAVMVKGIAEFRRREFYFEGLRWLDIKRFDIVVKHSLDGETESLVLGKGDPRRAIQIPESAKVFGIKPNKR